MVVLCGWSNGAIYLLQLLSNGALPLIHCVNDGQSYQKDCNSMNTGAVLGCVSAFDHEIEY